MKGISFNIQALPVFSACSYRYFKAQEKHISRTFNYYVLIFMLRRSLYFNEDGKDIAVTEKEWYIQVPNLRQEGLRGCPSPEYFYIHFSLDTPPAPTGESAPADIPRAFRIPLRGTFRKEYMVSLFDQLDEVYRKYPWDLLAQQAIFLRILNHLCPETPGTAIKNTGLVYRLIDDLHENYNKPLSLEALSRKYNYSKDYIARRLKKETGHTPFGYVLTLRLRAARELLSNTDYPIENIAQRVGYTEVSLFYKAFKADTGKTPGQWREESRRN